MTRERITDLRTKQQELRSFADEVEPPALCFLADQDAVFIKGNESGLIRFALELLEVASGGSVNASASEWIGTPYLPLEGIVLDPDPKHEETEPSFGNKVGAYTVFSLILIFLLIGAIQSITWVIAQFRH